MTLTSGEEQEKIKKPPRRKKKPVEQALLTPEEKDTSMDDGQSGSRLRPVDVKFSDTVKS